MASFHTLCGSIAKKAGVEIHSADKKALYDEILPEALMEAISRNPDLGFDTIIIDEGQDFRDSWLNALRLSIKDPETGRFYVFYDDNQRLFSPENGFIGALPASSIALTRNLRNTKKIHTLMSKWYKGKGSVASGPEGEPVAHLPCRNDDLVMSRVEERVAQLINSGQATAGQIAVLSGSARHSKFAEKIAGKPTCSAEDMRPDHIVVDTVKRFKGLSKPCVFLIGIEDLNEPELLYVATSRANLLLEIVGKAEDFARL